MKKYAILLILFAAFAANAQQNKFAETTAATKGIATKYFDLYMAMDWDKMEPLMHADITFEDPTAHGMFGDKRPVGKADVLKNFREGYASLTGMKAKLSRTFFSSNAAAFELDLIFGFRNRQNGITTITMPLVVTLLIKDGKVIEHRDFGDYTEYVRQVKASQEKSSK
ncbi:MAG: nuclear transport factor 2 family protein [Pyrinomonadaceae bacterium]